MSRTVFPFVANDVSALARSLHRELERCDHKPGHLQLLNMLTRSAGYRNFQHFRAAQNARERLEQVPAEPDPVDHRLVEKASRHFDEAGRLTHWPAKESHVELCLWVLWSKIPSGRDLTEPEMNAIVGALHSFADPALLRRALNDYRLVSRTPDCRQYRRIERRPPPEAIALIRHLGRHRRAG